MLPSIRHLLESDPAVSQSENTSNSSSSSTAPLTAMPSTALHPLHQKSSGVKQGDMTGPEQPHLQRNTPQHRKSHHHHPHPPYEPLHPPHPHSHFPTEYEPRVKVEGFFNGYSPKTRQDPGSLPPVQEHARTDVSSPSLPAEESVDPGAQASRSPGSLVTSWHSRRSPRTLDHSCPPSSSHAFSSSYRPQPQRASPLDPSLSSSSSSTSPSPSISTATVVSVPLNADAITSVTRGTAAASISDSRVAYKDGHSHGYGHGHSSSRGSLNKNVMEPTADEYSVGCTLAERVDPQDIDRTLSPTGGLVQQVPKHRSYAPYSMRSDSKDDPDYQRQQPYVPKTSSYKEGSPPCALSRFATHPQDQQGHYYTSRHGESSSSSTTFRRPVSPMDVTTYSSGSAQSNTYRHPSTLIHSSSPPSPPSTATPATDDRYDGPRSWPSDNDRDSRRLSPTRGHQWRYGSHSPTGNGAQSLPSPYDSHTRQHLPPDGSSYPAPQHHQTPHPSLQQEQPLPLYDHVRESDQNPSPSHSMANSCADRQLLHDQPNRHQLTAAVATSSPRETRSPRQSGAQPHGLATRSDRLASLNTSHPYHMTSYLPRSHLARPFEMDTPPRAISHPRLQDAPPFRPSDTVMSGTPSNRHHALSFTHSAQPTHLRGETARPQGYGFPGTVGDERASVALNPHPADNYHDPQEIRDGNWSDGGTGYEYKGHSKRGPETYSESMSVSASQLKESRRVIRMSVSESDLLAPEAAQRHNIRRNKYPETEGEEDEDEGDENEGYKFDEFEDEVEDDDELREHIRVRSAEGVQLSFRARGSEQRGIQDGQSHPQHQHHQSQPRQQNYAYNYDQGSKHSDAGYSPVSSRDAPPESGRPSHYPPHQSHAPAHAYHGSSMPHPHDYPSQQHQSRGQHVPQHPRSYSYPHHHPSSAPYHQHASAPHYQSLPTNLAMPTPGHPTSPRTASRRGPYLSRQRALLAGLEATSPSSRYQCQYCHKRFSRPSSLRIHTYSHTGERPFKCSEEGCGRQFSVQSNMRRHLRVHRLGRMRSEFPPQD